jgi:hypothetical protein
MSSRFLASERMSSRSRGVMKVAVVLDGLELHGLHSSFLEIRAPRDLREQPHRAQEVLGVLQEKLVEALLLGHEPPDYGIELHPELSDLR